VNKKQISWYVWGTESFEKAKQEEKPLLLFIGYKGCDWCEQMERESFVDEKTVTLIDEHCIAVRVDSHERPDIGRYSHRLFTQMTGREANYPLVIFLSADQIPLYTASYLPESSRDGMMGLGETVTLVAQKYRKQRALLLEKGQEIIDLLQPAKRSIEATALHSGIAPLLSEQIKVLHDSEFGGFGEKPKFPRYSLLILALDLYRQSREPAIATLLQHTLDAMIDKSLHDSEEGGFHRYCVDRAWQKPQRGKMLYDNALMSETLLLASQLLGEERYAIVALETVEFMRNKLMLDGCFCAFYDGGVVKDDRIIVSWNAMAIKAFFFAGKQDRIYSQMAITSLSKLLEFGMHRGVLYHSFVWGEEPETEAFLEDYAQVADLLIVAYEQTNEEHYLVKASELINEALKQFFNQGQWYYANKEITLLADTVDGDYAAALSVMSRVLQKATKLIDPMYEKFLQRTLEIHSYALMRQPISMPELARVAMRYL
jgi:uncharacterized protein YyaL (SSP411 family)